jgi:hypothetical protein
MRRLDELKKRKNARWKDSHAKGWLSSQGSNDPGYQDEGESEQSSFSMDFPLRAAEKEVKPY